MPSFTIDEIIRQAMQEGKFDNLPGKGKPLKIDQDPHQDPDWRLAHHVLKSAGYSLPWIERLKDIHSDLQRARRGLELAWIQRQERGNPEPQDSWTQSEWQLSVARFQERVGGINQQIRTYNLEVPKARFQIPLVDIDQEIVRVINQGDS